MNSSMAFGAESYSILGTIVARLTPRADLVDVELGASPAVYQPPARFAQQAYLLFSQHTAEFGGLALQPKQPLIARHQNQQTPKYLTRSI
jgi:hypothetical protein